MLQLARDDKRAVAAAAVGSLAWGAATASPTWTSLVAYALHSRSCIERGRLWQAEHYVGAVRDHALTLACLREGVPAVQARGYDALSAETLARFARTHVAALDAAALRSTLSECVTALIHEGEVARASAAGAVARCFRDVRT